MVKAAFFVVACVVIVPGLRSLWRDMGAGAATPTERALLAAAAVGWFVAGLLLAVVVAR